MELSEFGGPALEIESGDRMDHRRFGRLPGRPGDDRLQTS
jgi:hypothetical protein